MVVIVVVCTAFGLTVSEAKTEIMCLHTKGMPESTTIRQLARFATKRMNLYTSGGIVNHNAHLCIEVNRRIRRMVQLPEVHLARRPRNRPCV